MAASQAPKHAPTRGERMARIVAVAVGGFLALSGVWAFVAPTLFYEAVALFEPYNAHFVRDIGAFQIGLGAVLLLALLSRDALLVALAGVGIGSAFHVLGHVIDIDRGGTPAVDIPLFALVTVALLAAAFARWAGARTLID